MAIKPPNIFYSPVTRWGCEQLKQMELQGHIKKVHGKLQGHIKKVHGKLTKGELHRKHPNWSGDPYAPKGECF